MLAADIQKREKHREANRSRPERRRSLEARAAARLFQCATAPTDDAQQAAPSRGARAHVAQQSLAGSSPGYAAVVGRPAAKWHLREKRALPSGQEIRHELSEGGSARYALSAPGNSAQRLTSVSTIIDEMFNKRWGGPDGASEFAKRLEAAGVASAEEMATHLEAMRSDGPARLRRRAGEDAHRWIAESLRSGGLIDAVPQEHRAVVAAALHFVDHRQLTFQDAEVECLVCHPELRYASRADLIASSAAGSVLVDFKTVGGDQAKFPAPQLLIAAAVQVELLRLAAIRSGHVITDTYVVVIARDGNYSVLRGFVSEAVCLTLLEAFRARVNLTTVSGSARVQNEFKANHVAAWVVSDAVDPLDEDEDENEDPEDLFEELFDPENRRILFLEVDDE